MEVISSKFKLGILGGGQLGKMLIQRASAWDISCHVLDPTPNCPASVVANTHQIGSFNSYEDVMSFGSDKDVLTIEIENVNVDALKALRSQGKQIFPSPEAIETIKDKGLQKKFYRDQNIKTSAFELYQNAQSIREAINNSELKYPFVQKACREGYDGRGVVVIDGEKDLEKLLDTESLVEDKILIEKEISVIISRNQDGEVTVFDPAEMEFSEEANLVELLISPARLSNDQMSEAIQLGIKVIESLDLVGILAIEMFLTPKGEILVNEVAPRPHNSGHHTIEANISSQYEQHLRAILGMPLASCASIGAAVMVNILGSPGHSGDVVYKNADEVMKTKGAYLHVYGKKQTKPFRKMGHITIVGDDVNELIDIGKHLKNMLRVEAK